MFPTVALFRLRFHQPILLPLGKLGTDIGERGVGIDIILPGNGGGHRLGRKLTALGQLPYPGSHTIERRQCACFAVSSSK